MKIYSKEVDSWRTPSLVIGSGCLIAIVAFGPRSTLGFFLTPMSTAHHWGRDVFAFALALQNLLWGVGQPLGGIIADRFGTVRVLCAGALLYGLGLALMAHATSAPALDLSAGVLIGFGLAGCSFPVVLAALGQDRAEGMALDRLRLRHRGGIVRAIPLFAGRRGADGYIRLATDAADLRRQHAHRAAAVARFGDTAFGSDA